MKRLILLLVVAALAVPSAFAQFVPAFVPPFVPGSMENGMTLGLFENEIDQAFQANADFGVFANNFWFAGLGNPTAGTGTFTLLRAFSSNVVPFQMGYYMAGSMPISVFSSMDFTPLTLRNILGTTTTPTYGVPVTVTSGTTNTDYNWIQSSITDVATDVVLASTYQVDLQGLTKLGPVVTGLYLLISADNSSSDAVAANTQFVNRTQTFNVNTAGAGVIPVVTQDYTITQSIKNLNPGALPGAGGTGLYSFVNTFKAGVPFAMKTGNIEHQGYLAVNLASTDQSGAYSIVQSAHTQTAGAASNNDRTLSVTDKASTTDISGWYGLSIPAGAADNLWRAGVAFDVAIDGLEYSYDNVVRPYNLATLNTKTALTGGTHTVETTTYAPSLGITGMVTGARVFAFEPAKGLAFRFEPTVSILVLSSGFGPALTGSTNYTAPLDATGAVDGTIAYNTTSVAVTGNGASLFSLGGVAGLPMGVTIQPADWKFGIILGASPAMAATSVSITSSATTSTTTVVNTTGSTVNSTTITSTVNTPNVTGSMTYVLSENHYIGITVPFDGGAHFEARLNGSLLNFESFTIQAVIPFK